VQIEKKYSYSTLPSFTATSRGTTVAQEYVSFFPTQLALARWMRGGDIPHVQASERNMPMRAAWYAQAQRHFLAWLESGGLHQADDHCIVCAARNDAQAHAAMSGAGGDTDAHAASAFPVPGIDGWTSPEDER
jgi:hypothetical protein